MEGAGSKDVIAFIGAFPRFERWPTIRGTLTTFIPENAVDQL